MISVIVPTLGYRIIEMQRLFDSLHNQTYQNFEIILITQDNHECVHFLNTHQLNIKHIQLYRSGLSYARNEGLKNVNGNIIVFSDDDCWYPHNAFEKVMNYFQSYQQSNILCFQIFDPVKKQHYKKYSKRVIPKMNLMNLLKVSSIEFFIKIDSKNELDYIKFDENFGLGTNFPSGEENIFLSDLYKKRYIISYIPDTIVFHKKPDTNSRLTENQIISKGPLFKRIFNMPISFILLLIFFIKKRKYILNPWDLWKKTVKQTFKYRKGDM